MKEQLAATPRSESDLSSYDTVPEDAYEWFLSDHPWARAERIRRAAAYYESELRSASKAREYVARLDGPGRDARFSNDPAFIAAVRDLREQFRSLAENTELECLLNEAESDDIRVRRMRWEWMTYKWAAGADAYAYPEHLIGLSAAGHPPPASGFRTPRPRRRNGPKDRVESGESYQHGPWGVERRGPA